MLKKTKLRLCTTVVALAAAAAITVTSAPAFADPGAGIYKPLNGVGSDTIQDVMNGVAHDFSDIASYDAIDPVSGLAYGSTTTATTSPTVTIKTTATGNTFARPNGSGQGVTALSDSINGNLWNGVSILNQVDFARSSSGPSGNGTALTFLPFAQDAVTYAVNQASDFPRALAFDPTNPDGTRVSTTTLTLYNIYHCTRRTYTDSNLNPVTINPLLPQSGSGTRKYWESKLGLNDSSLPSCVKDVNSSGAGVEEHNGNALTSAGDIMPFSIAQYIAQGNHASLYTTEGVNVVERKGQAALGSIDGNKPYLVSSGKVIMNPAFPINRLVYNVVATSRLSDPAIAGAFVGNSSEVCSDASTIASFGFSTIGTACGVATGTQALG